MANAGSRYLLIKPSAHVRVLICGLYDCARERCNNEIPRCSRSQGPSAIMNTAAAAKASTRIPAATAGQKSGVCVRCVRAASHCASGELPSAVDGSQCLACGLRALGSARLASRTCPGSAYGPCVAHLRVVARLTAAVLLDRNGHEVATSAMLWQACCAAAGRAACRPCSR